jgi:hypothetical protein
LMGTPEGQLEKALAEIEEKKEKLSSLTNSISSESIPMFRSILLRAVRRQKDKEEEELIVAPLDPTKIRRFVANVIGEWRKAALIRGIIEKYGKMRKSGTGPTGIGFYGFNTIEPKDIYVEKSRLHASDWGSQHGRSIASTENDVVVATISKVISEKDHSRSKTRPLDIIDSALTDPDKRYSPNVILLGNALHIADEVRNASAFRMGELEGFTSMDFVGFYREIPAFHLFTRGERSRVYLLDLRRLGTWHQYEPKETFPEEEESVSVFRFYLRAYDDDRARELLEKRPELRVDPRTKERLSFEGAIRRLLQQVHLRILEQFEFKIEDQSAGIKLVFPRAF